MKATEFVTEYKKDRKSPKFNIKPRTGHAPTQTGAGPHKDKKKAQKQGDVKHKKKDIEESAEFGSNYAEQLAQQVFDHNPNLDTSGKADELLNLGYNMAKGDLGSRAQGIFRDEDFPSDLVSAYSWLQKQDNGMSERIRDPEDWDEGNTEPPNNMAVYINGKLWKVFKGNGYYADDEREMRQYYKLQDWARRKSQETGKKWEVSRTGAPATA